MSDKINSIDGHDASLHLEKDLYQYSTDEFSSIMPLYRKSKYQIPMIESVIEGRQKGRIFADKKVNPETIVIVTNFNWLYVIGNQESEIFKNQFCNFLVNELTSKSEHFAWFGLSQYWQDKLTEMFGQSVKSFPRVTYELDKEKYRIANCHGNLPNGYRIEPIDSNLVDKVSKFFDGIKMFWGTNENFLKSSLGFCILYENDIVSACQALAITEDICEIDVLTKDGFRGKELACFIGLAFIEHCLKLGLKPHWETVRANKSSCRLAEKLGFVEVKEYPFYAWFK